MKDLLRSALVYRRPGVTSDMDPAQLSVLREYKDLPVTGLRVMDVGGNIGAAAIMFALQKAEMVVSYEPFAANYDLLFQNTRPFPNIIVVDAALTNYPNNTILDLWVPNDKMPGSSSLTEFRGRTPHKVHSLNFMEQLNSYQFQSIKFDCEGAEWELLLKNEIPSFVTAIVGEFHFGKKHWRTDCLPALQQKLSSWQVILAPKDTGKNWHTIACWTR